MYSLRTRFRHRFACLSILALPLLLASAGGVQARMAPPAPPTSESTASATLEGRISSAEEGRALAGAMATLVETGSRTLSGTDGRYRFQGVEPGSYTLSVSFFGYRTVEQEVVLRAGETLQVDVQL